MEKITKFIRKLAIAFLRAYQLTISPFLGNCCRFYPSCSRYAIDAISTHGIFKGVFLTMKRLGRCHPWHSGGIDPVPKKTQEG